MSDQRLNKLENHSPEKSETQKNKEDFEMNVVDVGTRAEFAELSDDLEIGGEVSEELAESRDGKDGSLGSGAGKISKTAQLKIDLLKRGPQEKVMRAQVAREIEKEIDYLHSKAMRMLRSPSQLNYSEMNNLMSKIRELKGLLSDLAKVTYEGLKTLWLRFVHGVM